ncbi:MAG: DUF3105 domain-containing protein [Candidatus Hermodarchaeia archaeon]|jgi:hypothetical protein
MVKKTKRQQMRDKRRRQRLQSYIIWGGAGLVLLGILIILIRPVITQAAGETIPEMPSSQHISYGSDPGPFNSDPPTSGSHYAEGMDAGFYEEGDIEEFGPHPEGYLVHSLEHGYIIFWYNCDLLSESTCLELKEDIKIAIDDANNFKVIGFPWKSIDTPVVMTSWTRLHQVDKFDIDLAADFISRNRNRAPEPQAP